MAYTLVTGASSGIGMELAKEIKKRYNQVSAFPTFYSLQNSRIGKVEALTGEMKGHYSMHVDANYRLIMKI